jgi:hypothetical protein
LRLSPSMMPSIPNSPKSSSRKSSISLPPLVLPPIQSASTTPRVESVRRKGSSFFEYKLSSRNSGDSTPK